MGSAISRHVRDLFDVGGFEAHEDFPPPGPASQSEQSITNCVDSDSRPVTPATSRPLPDLDPRSPSADIVRTPIEVAFKYPLVLTDDSPVVGARNSRYSYLETDLDTLSTSATIIKTEEVSCQELKSLPAGLTNSHLMKLRFLGIDPRSPSSDITRTPIQLSKNKQDDGLSALFDDSLSIGSVSYHDLGTSLCSSEFTRDCSDPSAFLSEIDDTSDKEDENKDEKRTPAMSVAVLEGASTEEPDCLNTPILKEENVLSVEGTPKTSKLLVFQEDDQKSCEEDTKIFSATPESTKKSTGLRSRTPLTPICNQNRTPNNILRAKQSQAIQKEILTKAKIYSTEDSILTPPRVRPLSSNKKENSLGRNRKAITSNTDSTSVKKHVLAQWDQDNSVVI